MIRGLPFSMGGWVPIGRNRESDRVYRAARLEFLSPIAGGRHGFARQLMRHTEVG